MRAKEHRESPLGTLFMQGSLNDMKTGFVAPVVQNVYGHFFCLKQISEKPCKGCTNYHYNNFREQITQHSVSRLREGWFGPFIFTNNKIVLSNR